MLLLYAVFYSLDDHIPELLFRFYGNKFIFFKVTL